MVSIMFYNLYINDVGLPVKIINVSNDVKQGGYIFFLLLWFSHYFKGNKYSSSLLIMYYYVLETSD